MWKTEQQTEGHLNCWKGLSSQPRHPSLSEGKPPKMRGAASSTSESQVSPTEELEQVGSPLLQLSPTLCL